MIKVTHSHYPPKNVKYSGNYRYANQIKNVWNVYEACTNEWYGCKQGGWQKLSEGTSKSDSEHRECFLKSTNRNWIRKETGHSNKFSLKSMHTRVHTCMHTHMGIHTFPAQGIWDVQLSVLTKMTPNRYSANIYFQSQCQWWFSVENTSEEMTQKSLFSRSSCR